MCCYLAAHEPASIFLQFPTTLKTVQGPFWSTSCDLVFKLVRCIGTLTIPLTYDSTGQLPAPAPDKATSDVYLDTKTTVTTDGVLVSLLVVDMDLKIKMLQVLAIGFLHVFIIVH